MHFLKTLLIGASAFAVASAQLAFTSVPTSVEAGKQYILTYSGGSGSVEIILRKGASSNLQTIATLSTGATGGTFTWTPDTSLPSGSDYALQIKSGGQDNYAGPITLTGGAASTASITGSMATMSLTTAYRNVTTTAANSTVTAVTTARNATVSSATLTATTSVTTTAAGGASRTGASSGTGATTAPTNAAAAVQSSPLALVLCAIVGLIYLN